MNDPHMRKEEGKAMAKVLFFNLPAHGHTNPTLPLVAELVRRGEHVIYYSSEAFRPAIEQAGATFRGIDAFFERADVCRREPGALRLHPDPSNARDHPRHSSRGES